MSYNRCKDIHKFGNKYLPPAYKTQVDFRSHFSGKKVCLIVREIGNWFSIPLLTEKEWALLNAEESQSTQQTEIRKTSYRKMA